MNWGDIAWHRCAAKHVPGITMLHPSLASKRCRQKTMDRRKCDRYCKAEWLVSKEYDSCHAKALKRVMELKNVPVALCLESLLCAF